jgi:hypothetical protein
MPRSRHRKKKVSRRPLAQRYIDEWESAVPTDESMSGTILDFIEPYRQFAPDEESFGKLVALGIVAWNVALLPESERTEALDEFARAALREQGRSRVGRLVRWVVNRLSFGLVRLNRSEAADLQTFKANAHEMIERKERAFGHNRRFILDYTVSGTGDEAKLFVVSTLSPINT